MGLRQRLENLVSNPLVVDSTDYEFAKSLLAYYEKKGALSSGRRPWLDKLEEKYNPETYVDPMNSPIGARLNKLHKSESISSGDLRFVESLRSAYARYGNLTPRQLNAFERVEERYSDEGVKRASEWQESYKSLRDDAVIAAKYYASNPPYYGDLANRILSEPDFVPTERQYNAITQNKYAQKVIAATKAEPLYPVNSLVQGRTSAPRNIRNKRAFILQTNAGDVVTAAKGTKRYLVLPVGEPSPVLVEERWIKKVKKLKK